MKVLMENWRYFLKEEDELLTVGQLRAALQKAREDKKAGVLGKGLLGALSNAVGIDLVKDMGIMLRDLYKLPDSQKTNTYLDKLNVDDKVSDIVDDAIENMFLNDAAEEFAELPDETPLEQIDITQRLADFIAKKFDDRTVAVPDNS